MMKIAIVVLLFLVVAGWFMAGLPGVYGQLAPSQQIAVYGRRLKLIPFPSEGARSGIAAHGEDAANALAADLVRREPRLSPGESAYILAMIQHRGTPLRNTAAERALKAFLRGGRATPADLIAAQFALNAIENDVRLPPELQPR